MNDEVVLVASIPDSLEAEILRGLLLSYGIDVWLSRESVSAAIGLTVGPLAQVDLLVPKSQYERADRIVNDYYTGNLESSN